MKISFRFFVFIIGCLVFPLIVSLKNTKLKEIYVGDKNYTKVLKDQLINDDSKVLIAILFTNKNCETCDAFEAQIREIQSNFIEENIPILRCDISVNKILSDKFQIKRFPVVHFIYKQPTLKDQQYPQIQIYKTAQILTSKIIQTAKYLRKILNFLQNKKPSIPLVQTLQQIPSRDKIVVNIKNLEEFYQYDEMGFIHELILDESFNAMPIVPLTGQLFDFYSVSNDLQHLNKKSKSEIFIFIVLEQEQDHPFIHIPIEIRDFERLISQNLDIKSIFKSFLFYSVQQFTQNIYLFQQQFYSLQNSQIPIYLAVVDTIWKRQQAKTQVMMLNRVIHTFEKEALIFWIQAEINPEKKLLLGFQKSTKPPMFGKLILTKNQLKQPLKNPIKNTPIFTENDIKTKIRTDLGYERILPQKIRFALQQLGLSNLIEITNNFQTQKGNPKVQFAYCISKYVSNDQINELEYIIRRFRRFYPTSSMKILTYPCFINNNSVEDGLFMSFGGKSHLVSQKILSCFSIQPKIQKITKEFAQILNRKKLIPKNFCVPEKEMKYFLINLKE